MQQLEFYRIQSKKSEEISHGHKKTTFVCSGFPDIYLFLWRDENERIVRLQFVFNERLIEWDEHQGVRLGVTNRWDQSMQKTGILKGSRTIHPSEDPKIFLEGMEILRHAKMPGEFLSEILSRIENAASKGSS